MAHIVFDLSSSESRSRFRELATDMLDLLDGPMSERFLARLKAKAQVLELAAPDFHAIMLELLRASGGCGFMLCDTGLRCPACNAEQNQVAWLCAKCGGLMIEDIAIRQREADRLQRERQELEAESKRIAEERSRLAQTLCDLEKHSRNELLEPQRENLLRKPEKSKRKKQPEIEMVDVPGGEFYMGKELIRVQSFKIGKYPVTQGVWKAVMDNNPSHYKTSDRHPVENVSYYDTTQFISRLNQLTEKSYRLPIEEEWEYAARSGGRDEKWAGTSFEWELEYYAWTNSSYISTTQPVGMKRPNGLGIYDMSGNVWEWCNTMYDSSGSEYMIRGGAWNYSANDAKNSFKKWTALKRQECYIGFRLAHD
jgi:formylglycine-generating enzyme required for sulfatase activity